MRGQVRLLGRKRWHGEANKSGLPWPGGVRVVEKVPNSLGMGEHNSRWGKGKGLIVPGGEFVRWKEVARLFLGNRVGLADGREHWGQAV